LQGDDSVVHQGEQRGSSIDFARSHVSETIMPPASSDGAGQSAATAACGEVSSPQLSEEQRRVEDVVASGQNVFFTGEQRAHCGIKFLPE